MIAAPVAASTVVELRGVSKIYQMGEVQVTALKDADLRFKEGELVIILGPSGCGKSTLMNLIGGLDTPTSGQILIEGQDISTYSEDDLTEFRRRFVGFIFQFFNLVSTLTAKENVQLAAELAENPLDVQEVMESVGLAARGEHFPSELSGGEQQRVAIARALVKRPPLLLCDEPTGELDFETGRRVLALLHEVTHTHGETVLMVTHNAALAEMGDRVIRLRSGQVISDEHNINPIDPMELKW